MSNPKESDTDKINQSQEETKEQLLRELSENLNLGQEENKINKKEDESKFSMQTMPETIEISCIEPSDFQKEKYFKNTDDNTIINVFGDDDDNLVSFYGEGGDLEKLVNTLDVNKKNNNEPDGYLTAFNITKIGSEHLAKFTQSIDQKDLMACKKVIDKLEFDGKMITKVNEIKYLYMKSKDISNDAMDKILGDKEHSNDLFAWRDIMPGEDSFFRAIMFSYIESLILSNDFEEYKCFLFYLGTNICESYFSKILSFYQIDITRVRISLAILYYAFNSGSSDRYIEKTLSLFIKTYNMDPNFDLLLILNLKYLIYKYIKYNENKLYSKELKVRIGDLLPSKYIKNGKYLFKEFYEKNLLQLRKGVDKISVSVIPFILRRNLYIYSFENNKITHNLVDAESKQNKELLPIRIVNLNGNYDIIYEKKYYTKYLEIFSVYSNIPKSCINGETKKEDELRNQNIKANDIDRENLNFLNISNDDFEKTIINNYKHQQTINTKIYKKNNNNVNSQQSNKNINNINMNQFNSKTAMNNNINSNFIDNQNNINLNNSNYQKKTSGNIPGQNNINNNQMNNNGYMNMMNHNNMNNNMNNNNHNNINNNMNNNMNKNMSNNMNNINNNINNNMNNNMNSNINNNNMNNMYNNMNHNMNNNMMNNMNNSGNLNNNMNSQNYNNMTNNYTTLNSNMSSNLSNSNSNLNNNQINIKDNFNPKTERDKKVNIMNNQFDIQTNINYNNQMGMNSVNPSSYMNQSLMKQCPQCKKPNKDNFYCEQCLLNHLISYAENNYIEFLNENINNSNMNNNLKKFDEFLSNLNVIFPNASSKTFSESYYLLTNPNKNIFNEHLNKFKTSICLNCKKSIDKSSEFLDNTYLRFPCGCIFCNYNCLNTYLNKVPLNKMQFFQCSCGVTYEYIQLKYLLFFSISFDFKKLRKEVMRYMYEIVKTRCCKCKKDKEKLSKDQINVSVMELIDQEGGRIFDIHKFHHLICEKCKKSFDFNKNKFYCNLCVSEHSIVKKPDSQNIQMNNSCTII